VIEEVAVEEGELGFDDVLVGFKERGVVAAGDLEDFGVRGLGGGFEGWSG
jgi:hypothetical protein